jgi:hypothetical protein
MEMQLDAVDEANALPVVRSQGQVPSVVTGPEARPDLPLGVVYSSRCTSPIVV